MGPTGTPAWLTFGRTILRLFADSQLPPAPEAVEDANQFATQEPALSRDSALSRVAQLRSELGVALQHDGAFAALAANAGLDQDAAEVLAVVTAAEADWSVQQLIGRVNGDANRNRVPVGWLPLLFGKGHRGVRTVSPDGPLRRAALIDVEERGPFADHALAVAPPVVWALLGDDSRDPGLPAIEEFEVPHGMARAGAADLVVVVGPDKVRRRIAASAVANADRYMCLALPDAAHAWAAVIREATITGRGVVLEFDHELPELARRNIERANHLTWVLSAPHPPTITELPGRPWVEVEAPAHEATGAEWAAVIGRDVGRPHRISLEQLEKVKRVLPATGGDIDAAVRRLAAGRLEQLTRRVRPTRQWDDIVLSPERRILLRSIVDRARVDVTVFDEWGYSATPSRGLVALFSGPSGTGKTLAAEIIAGELGLDLFKLDLSSVVSKYIGETEKHLDELFDAAGAGNAVLFFDEADSLFGKRSEVRDARDRYANIEVSYLLQRLESYDGVVIMATNFEKNVDEAFLRRIHVRIAFAVPAEAEREMIWRQALPSSAPVSADVDVAWLARQFDFAGGAIRNAALTAAFIAAAAGTDITMACVVEAVVREYRKLGRLITAKDFGEHLDSLGSD